MLLCEHAQPLTQPAHSWPQDKAELLHSQRPQPLPEYPVSWGGGRRVQENPHGSWSGSPGEDTHPALGAVSGHVPGSSSGPQVSGIHKARGRSRPRPDEARAKQQHTAGPQWLSVQPPPGTQWALVPRQSQGTLPSAGPSVWGGTTAHKGLAAQGHRVSHSAAPGDAQTGFWNKVGSTKGQC